LVQLFDMRVFTFCYNKTCSYNQVVFVETTGSLCDSIILNKGAFCHCPFLLVQFTFYAQIQ